jgi:hypothetical protein
MISALALAAVAMLAGAVVTGSHGPKAAAAHPHTNYSDNPGDFLLLHEGDYVRVQFRDDAGPDSIQYLSLSDASRLDIIHPTAGAGKYLFRKVHGWQTYPHGVAGQRVTIILRETSDHVPTVNLPGCSDVVVRIENAAVLSPYHTHGSDQGRRCEVCGAVLDW